MSISRTVFEASHEGFLVSEAKIKILDILKDNPDRAFDAYELAELVGCAPETSTSCLRQLSKDGFLWSKKIKSISNSKGRPRAFYVLDKKRMDLFFKEITDVIESTGPEVDA